MANFFPHAVAKAHSGRNEIKDFNEWAKLDLQYIDSWSLGLDIKIFLKTIPVVLLRKEVSVKIVIKK